MKTINNILGMIGWMLPIGYALYTRTWQPVLLSAFFILGVFVGIVHSQLSDKEASKLDHDTWAWRGKM